MRVRTAVVFALFLLACGSGSAPAGTPPAPPPTPPPAPPSAAEAHVAPADPSGDGPHGRSGDLCAQIVVVAWHGADHAPDTVTRSEADARARADALRARISGGAAFADVAGVESDAPTSRAHGGIMGTFASADWPPLHAPLLPVVQALQVGQLGEVVRLPYGFVVPSRCEVRKVHVAHILVRYHGAKNAEASVTRSSAEARALAEQIRAGLVPGGDFAAVAREKSEDASASRGGDLGWVGLGMFQPEFERAAFALAPGQVSPVVETAFGFHVIESLQ